MPLLIFATVFWAVLVGFAAKGITALIWRNRQSDSTLERFNARTDGADIAYSVNDLESVPLSHEVGQSLTLFDSENRIKRMKSALTWHVSLATGIDFLINSVITGHRGTNVLIFAAIAIVIHYSLKARMTKLEYDRFEWQQSAPWLNIFWPIAGSIIIVLFFTRL